MKNNIVIIFAFILLSIESWYVYKLHNEKKNVVIKTIVHHKTDTLYKIKPYVVKVPKIDTIKELQIDTSNIDTLLKKYKELILLYKTSNYYKDTISLDSIGKFYYFQKIQNNTLDTFIYGYNIKYVTNKTIVENKDRNVNFFVGGGYNNGLYPVVGIGLNKFNINVGYDFNKNFNITVLYKIK